MIESEKLRGRQKDSKEKLKARENGGMMMKSREEERRAVEKGREKRQSIRRKKGRAVDKEITTRW